MRYFFRMCVCRYCRKRTITWPEFANRVTRREDYTMTYTVNDSVTTRSTKYGCWLVGGSVGEPCPSLSRLFPARLRSSSKNTIPSTFYAHVCMCTFVCVTNNGSEKPVVRFSSRLTCVVVRRNIYVLGWTRLRISLSLSFSLCVCCMGM